MLAAAVAYGTKYNKSGKRLTLFTLMHTEAYFYLLFGIDIGSQL